MARDTAGRVAVDSVVRHSEERIMDYYCVAKSKEAGFIGQLTLEDITRRFRAGELLGDYVATKSLGLSHHQIMKSGLAAWVTVAALVAHPPVQNKLPANTLVVVWRERTRTPVY